VVILELRWAQVAECGAELDVSFNAAWKIGSDIREGFVVHK